MALYSWFELTNKNVENKVVINKGMWPNACPANSNNAATLAKNKNKESLVTQQSKHSVVINTVKAPLITQP